VGVESRSVFGTRRSDKTPPKLSEAEELAELKKLLRAQGVARQREQENIIEVQRQLTSLETETSRVRGDLKCVQEQLADAKVEHTGALRRATEREAGLRNELVEVHAQATKTREKASAYRRLAVFCTVLLMPVMSWAAVKYWPTLSDGDKTRTETARGEVAPVSGGVAKDTPDAFTTDTQRLDQALGYFGNESPEKVLRKVHDENAARGISVCSFETNGGQVSLLFGAKPGTGLSNSMTRCADAVEQAGKKLGR
jgi:hypothetical protein